jgi:hypothetical protein
MPRHPFLRGMERFVLGYAIGSYVGRSMKQRHERVGEWTTPRVRGFLLVAVLFTASLAASTVWPQRELWFIFGALSIGEAVRRAYMAAQKGERR